MRWFGINSLAFIQSNDLCLYPIVRNAFLINDYICVCVFICIYTFIYVYIYIYINIYICICICICICISICICTLTGLEIGRFISLNANHFQGNCKSFWPTDSQYFWVTVNHFWSITNYFCLWIRKKTFLFRSFMQ